MKKEEEKWKRKDRKKVCLMVLLFVSTATTFTVKTVVVYVACYKTMLTTMFCCKFHF